MECLFFVAGSIKQNLNFNLVISKQGVGYKFTIAYSERSRMACAVVVISELCTRKTFIN